MQCKVGRLHSIEDIEEPEMFNIFSLGIVDIVECEKLSLKVFFFKINVLFRSNSCSRFKFHFWLRQEPKESRCASVRV